MKPHEQEWRLDRHLVVNQDGKGVCRMQGSAATVEAEALILAAPEMAREIIAARDFLALLLDGNPAWRKVDAEAMWRRMNALLSKAGVE